MTNAEIQEALVATERFARRTTPIASWKLAIALFFEMFSLPVLRAIGSCYKPVAKRFFSTSVEDEVSGWARKTLPPEMLSMFEVYERKGRLPANVPSSVFETIARNLGQGMVRRGRYRKRMQCWLPVLSFIMLTAVITCDLLVLFDIRSSILDGAYRAAFWRAFEYSWCIILFALLSTIHSNFGRRADCVDA